MRNTMHTNEKQNTNKYLNWALGLFGIFLLFGLIATCVNRVNYNGFRIISCHRIKTPFQVTWGEHKTETTLPATIENNNMETVSISCVLHSEQLGYGDSILFRSRQCHTRVYLDDVLIYDSGNAYDSPFSMGYGSFWKNLPLGANYNRKTLRIELQPAYDMPSVTGYLPKIYFGTQASFIAMILKHNLWVLIFTTVLILLGIYDITYGSFSIHRKKAAQLFFLGLFSLDTGIWMLVECHVLELFVSNMHTVVYLSYLTYGLMPVLLLRFLLSYEEFRKKTYLQTICIAGVFLNFIQFIISAIGIYSLFESQWLNRVYLGLTILGLLTALFSIHRSETSQEQKKLYGGIFILVVSTILELVYFLFVNKENSGRILILGIALFIFKSGIDLIHEGKRMRKDDLEKELLQAMAYTDAMTHLGNRFAYEQEKHRLEKTAGTYVTILIADMNGLKHANDTHGHSYGDRIICKTADILNASFKKVGKCYRIGGDEFCVLAENIEQPDFEACIKNMNEQAAKLHNTITDYGIAFGVARGDSTEIDDIFHKADNLMYDCKKQMKAKRI